jgi:imidazole glycerol-phosphate synthase subunit HisH
MKVTIVDYGMGNLYSVQRAVEVCGITNVTIGSTPSDLAEADRLILPGVGAFKDGMQGLKDAGLDEAIKSFAASGKPILGICLGAQMLVSTSDEFGFHEGLGLIPGTVSKIPALTEGENKKLPFIGWSKLDAAHGTNGFGSTCLNTLAPRDSVYLVHSYHVSVDDAADLLATYNYEGVTVTAAFQRDNIMGVQFHPEKSGVVGLRILAGFLDNDFDR